MDDNDRQEWLERRQTGIGASEVATILNLNPYKTRYQLWQDKTGPAREIPDNEAMYWGRLLEDHIAQRYAELTGNLLIDPGRHNSLQHPTNKRLFATLDRVIHRDGDTGALECKNIGATQVDKWKDNSAPIYYKIQLQVQLEVMGWEWGVLAALLGGNRFSIVEYERDKEIGEMILDRVTEFWGYVESGEPPPDVADAIDVDIAKKFNHESGETVTLNKDQTETYYKWRASADALSDLKRESDRYKKQLQETMGSATYALIPGCEYKLKWETSRREVRPSVSYPRTFRRVKK